MMESETLTKQTNGGSANKRQKHEENADQNMLRHFTFWMIFKPAPASAINE